MSKRETFIDCLIITLTGDLGMSSQTISDWLNGLELPCDHEGSPWTPDRVDARVKALRGEHARRRAEGQGG